MDILWITLGIIYIIYRFNSEKPYEKTKRAKKDKEFEIAHNYNYALQHRLELALCHHPTLRGISEDIYQEITGKKFFPRYGINHHFEAKTLFCRNCKKLMEFYWREMIKDFEAMGYNYSYENISAPLKRELILSDVIYETNDKNPTTIIYPQSFIINGDEDFTEIISKIGKVYVAGKVPEPYFK